MNMEVYKRREISYEQCLQIIFFKNNGKSYGKIAKIVAAQRVQLFLYVKSSTNQELSTFCQRLVDQRNSRHQDRSGI